MDKSGKSAYRCELTVDLEDRLAELDNTELYVQQELPDAQKTENVEKEIKARLQEGRDEDAQEER